LARIRGAAEGVQSRGTANDETVREKAERKKGKENPTIMKTETFKKRGRREIIGRGACKVGFHKGDD